MTTAIRVRPPPGPVSATLTPPGSKSLTNRALVLAAMAEGTSTLRGCLDSEDTQVMRAALRRCGVTIDVEDGAETVRVAGVAGPLPRVDAPEAAIDVATALFPYTTLFRSDRKSVV